MYETEDDALEHALHLLFAKGSEGDGELHLDAEATHVLAEYVRRLRRRRAMEQTTVVFELDGKRIAEAVIPHMSNVIRRSSGTRNF